MVKKISIIVDLVIVLIFAVLLVLGLQPQIWISKILLCILLLILGLNIFLRYKGNFKNSKKIIHNIILVQIEIAIIIVIVIVIRNINVNTYYVEKNGQKFVMSIDVNNNVKKYFRYVNKLVISREVSIEEYMSDTDEDELKCIKYNKEVFPDEVDITMLETTKKVIDADNLEEQDRILKYITNYEELSSFCSEYSVDNNYTEDYFQDKDIVVVSYVLFKESIPFVAVGEDNNIYVYIKDDTESTQTTKSFCFIEINKTETNEVIVKDYDATMKNTSF